MKKFLFVSVLLAMLPFACLHAESKQTSNNDDIITRQVSFNKPFNAIKASQGVEIQYTVIPEGQKATATLKVRKSILDSVEIKIDDNRLCFGFKNKSYSKNINSFGDMFSMLKDMFKNNNYRGQTAVLYVSAPPVENLKASSGANINVLNELNRSGNIDLKTSSAGSISVKALKCDICTANTSSGSEIKIKSATINNLSIDTSSGSKTKALCITAKNISASSSSGSGIDLEGSAGNASLDASSGSSIDGKGLVTRTATVEASSGASASVTYTEHADTKSSSGGSARSYKASLEKD